MSKQDNGGPAFPTMDDKRATVSDGISVRDYFAAKAMQGLIAGSMADGSRMGAGDEYRISRAAYFIADAMLAAREAA